MYEDERGTPATTVQGGDGGSERGLPRDGQASTEANCTASTTDCKGAAAVPDVVNGEAVDAKPNTKASVEFLQRWAPEGPWALTAISVDPKKTETKTFRPNSIELMRYWIGERNGLKNLYFTVNPVIGDITKKASYKDIASMDWLHCDVDPPDPDPSDNEEQKRALLVEERARILQMLRDPPGGLPKPTKIIDSGGGFQAFWKLKEPVPINGEKALAKDAKLYNKGIEALLGGDYCHDVARVMRLPGTVNIPDAKKLAKGRVRATAEVVESDDKCVYSIEQFKKTRKDDVAPGAKGGGKKPANVEISGNVERLQSVDELPKNVPDWVKKLIVQGCDPDNPHRYPTRSEPLFAVCCELVRCGVDDATIYAVITDSKFKISKSVIEKKSAKERYAKRQIERAHEKDEESTPSLDDIGNGERLARAVRDRMLYCYAAKGWMIYDGGRWRQDPGDRIARASKQTAKAILDVARAEEDEDRQRRIIKWALQSRGKERLRAMEFMAQSELPVDPAELDSDPMLLNVRNCTIDLRTGRPRPHDPDDLITRRCEVEFQENAACPMFDQLVSDVMQGDEKMVDYLQRAIGYSLTGDTREQAFFIPYGGGSNGKSTLFSVITSLMGDYAHTANMGVFIAGQQPGEGPTEGLASMRGARMVLASEIRAGAPLDEPTMKLITGGENIRARFLHQNSFEYRPAFKVWLVVNHLPAIRGTDDGIWRRVRVLPFERQFTENDQDKTLADRIIASELPGLLNWALEGCRQWQREGLGWTDMVKDRTKIYRTDSDALAAWFEDECVRGEGFKVPVKQAAASYYAWCDRNGERPMSRARLGNEIVKHGHQSKTADLYGEKVRCYHGLKLQRLVDEPREVKANDEKPKGELDEIPF